MCEGCNRIRKVNVDGTIYNYIVRNVDPGCIEAWCQIRKATIEVAPKKYKNIYSDKEITEQEVKDYLTNHK
jgi:hypothetical protein